MVFKNRLVALIREPPAALLTTCQSIGAHALAGELPGLAKQLEVADMLDDLDLGDPPPPTG